MKFISNICSSVFTSFKMLGVCLYPHGIAPISFFMHIFYVNAKINESIAFVKNNKTKKNKRGKKHSK